MKKIIYGLSIIAFVLIIMVGFRKIFSFKYDDGIQQVKSFYQLEDNTLDVLVLGSSHAYVNILPEEIWKKKGITAFDLCGSVAPMWNSYYLLQEAMKTQSPQLIVLEAFCLTQDYEYADDSRVIKNICGLKPSASKIEAIKASLPQETRLEFELEYIQYHNRYKDLYASDFCSYNNDKPKYEKWLGSYCLNYVTEFSEVYVNKSDEKTELPIKQSEYYSKIIQYCKENDLELLVVVTPYPGYTQRDSQIYNTAKEMAEQAGYSFVNFQEQSGDIGMDWSCDYADYAHMNYRGSIRFADYFANFLSDEYSLESHDKKDELYDIWNSASYYFDRRSKGFDINRITDINEYALALKELDDSYTIIVSISDSIKWIKKYPKLKKLLSSWKISKYDVNSPEKIFCVIDDFGANRYADSVYNYKWAKRFGGKELLVCNSGVYFERDNYFKPEANINIVVFDEETQVIVDSVEINNDGIFR